MQPQSPAPANLVPDALALLFARELAYAGGSCHPRSSVPRSGTAPSSASAPAPGLLSRLTDADVSVPGVGPVRAAPSAPLSPTPVVPLVGFPALLPVIYEGSNKRPYAASDSVWHDASGDIDFEVQELYVYAMGSFSEGRPAWSTSLVKRTFFTSVMGQLLS